jgi:hypothetical protein
MSSERQRLRDPDGDLVAGRGHSSGVSAVPPRFDEANGYAKSTLPSELYKPAQRPGFESNVYSKHPTRWRN